MHAFAAQEKLYIFGSGLAQAEAQTNLEKF